MQAGGSIVFCFLSLPLNWSTVPFCTASGLNINNVHLVQYFLVYKLSWWLEQSGLNVFKHKPCQSCRIKDCYMVMPQNCHLQVEYGDLWKWGRKWPLLAPETGVFFFPPVTIGGPLFCTHLAPLVIIFRLTPGTQVVCCEKAVKRRKGGATIILNILPSTKYSVFPIWGRPADISGYATLFVFSIFPSDIANFWFF